jgi:hypothetical protein
VHWHAQFEDPVPILPETCFNDPCVKQFSEDTGIKVPEGSTSEKAQWILQQHDEAWRDWRCQVIVEWAVEIRAILEELRPGALLGLYHCPWTDDEYQGARRRMLGLDYDLLVEVIDVFSPMVYHGRMERPPSWVGENIEWFSKSLDYNKNSDLKIWPIVQAYNDPHVIPPHEFEMVLRDGLSGKANGVMMFTTYAVAEDKQKMEMMKQVYKSLSK